MNSDTYQHKKESIAGDSHSTGQEMETGKDISKVSHKNTLLIMAGSLFTLLVWIAMTGHSGGAGGNQYVTAVVNEMTQEADGALAAESQGEAVKSGVLAKDIFGLGSEVDTATNYCGPSCEGLMEEVNAVGKGTKIFKDEGYKVTIKEMGTPWCDQSSFKSINGIKYCFAACDKHRCDHSSLAGLGLTSVVSMIGEYSVLDTLDNSGERYGKCVTDYCTSGGADYGGYSKLEICPFHNGGDYGSYLCQKCPTIVVPAPTRGGSTWCENDGYYSGEDGNKYCWSSCAARSGARSCRHTFKFWRLGACQSHKCSPGQYSNLCQSTFSGYN